MLHERILAASDHLAIDTVANVLLRLSGDIEDLGATLCMDAQITERHIATLQAIDLIAQQQRCLASILLAHGPAAEALRIPLEALRKELAVALGHEPPPPGEMN